MIFNNVLVLLLVIYSTKKMPTLLIMNPTIVDHINAMLSVCNMVIALEENACDL